MTLIQSISPLNLISTKAIMVTKTFFTVLFQFQRLVHMGILRLQHTIHDAVELIAKLPESQRQVLLMRYYEDMSFKEIAQKTNCSINTALGRMRYALLNLKKMSRSIA